MKLGIMQPFFFPYIGYFQAINAVDKYILYDRLNFIKDRWMNRNRILVVNGQPKFFTIPLANKSSYNKIYQIELEDTDYWREKLCRNIMLNYKKSPYFEEIYPIIKKIIFYKTNFLNELNNFCIVELCSYLEIKTIIETNTTQYEKIEEKLDQYENDLEQGYPQYDLTLMQKKVIRVFEICKQENAETFVNAIGGTALYDKKEFKKNGIDVTFVQTNSYTYKQRSDNFFPGLSIIDVLMNCGKEGTQKLLDKCTLI